MKFPVYPTRFIGRKNERQKLIARIRQKSFRLITLTGPGGIGKTRLAHEVLTSGVEVFEDGIVWLDLADVSGKKSVRLAFCSVLGLTRLSGQSPDIALAAYLKHRETLIVLDNCEHVLSEISRLCKSLLDNCPTLHLLATSRERLNLPDEEVWPVQPLTRPEEDTGSLDSIAHLDAVELFTARAKQVDPAFTLSNQDTPQLVRIHKLLEGLPLAVELAASWTNVLTLNEMAEQLEKHPGFLSKRARQAEGRHRSLWETIRWSYHLLPGSEKTIFISLAVFSGSFSAEAVDVICAPDIEGNQPTLFLLGRLIDQSLVFRERSGSGESRYRMLETIRQFALEELQLNGNESRLRSRHRDYFTDLARRAEPQLVGPDLKRWTERLDADHENLIAALNALILAARKDKDQLLQAVRTANRLFWAWNYTERFQEGSAVYASLRAIPGFAADTREGADLIRHQGTFTWLLGNYEDAKTLLTESIRAAHSCGYSFCIAHAQLLIGIMLVHQEQPAEAIPLLEESVGIFEALDETRGLAIALTNLGSAHLGIHELKTSNELLVRAVQLTQDQGDPWGLGLSLMVHSSIIYESGRKSQALETLDKAISLLRQTGQDWLGSEALWRKAKMLTGIGDDENALRSLETCFDIAQEIGALEWQVASLLTLGEIYARKGRYEDAGEYYRQALRFTGGKSYSQSTLKVIEGLTHLAAAAEKWELAAVLLSAADHLRTFEVHDPEWTRLRIRLIKQLEPAGFEARVREGTNLSLQEAADLAFEVPDYLRPAAVPSEPGEALQIKGLGLTEVSLNGRLLVPADWTFAKPRELLFYLISNPPKTKDQIGLVFWPDASPSQLRASLRASLYHLRKALGQRDWILYENGMYRFNHHMSYWYDVEEFETSLQRGKELQKEDAAGACEWFETGIALYRGDFLTDIASDDWAFLRREQLRTQYLGSLHTLGTLYFQRDMSDHAIRAFVRLSSEDPLREDACRGLMTVYAARGERARAIQEFQGLRERLLAEIGVEPSDDTIALYHTLQ